MNHVERFRAVMNFQPVDRLPCIEWAGWWDKTIDRWHGEGLAAGLTDAFEIRSHLGLDPYHQVWFPTTGPNCPQPAHHGAGLISTHDDYDAIREHLFPPVDDAIEALVPWAEKQARGDAVVWISLDGFFWFPRKLLGIEAHLYAFYDQAGLMHRINSDLAGHHVRIIEGLREACRPCFMTFGEDMSYNHGPMLSRGLFDEFLAPYYRRVIPLLREMGTRVLVDSDGDISQMVPWLESVGIEGVLPLERQAGVDGWALRQKHPRWLMIGHYDKMVMPHGEEAMRAEFERLLPLMKSGGFIPSCDHQTPPGVSLEQYGTYLRLMGEYCRRAGQ